MRNGIFRGGRFLVEQAAGTIKDDIAGFVAFAPQFLRRGIHPAVKWSLWLAAWGGVVLATISHDPHDLAGALGFPVGFCGLLPAEPSVWLAWLGGWFVVGAGWGLYCWLSLVMLLPAR